MQLVLCTICLTIHELKQPDNLKIQHRFSPNDLYTNQKFCFICATFLVPLWYSKQNFVLIVIVLRFFRKDLITEDFVGFAWETHWKGPTKADDVVFIFIEFTNAQ